MKKILKFLGLAPILDAVQSIKKLAKQTKKAMQHKRQNARMIAYIEEVKFAEVEFYPIFAENKGLHKFDMDGIVVYAINLKNAIKKIEKIKKVEMIDF